MCLHCYHCSSVDTAKTQPGLSHDAPRPHPLRIQSSQVPKIVCHFIENVENLRSFFFPPFSLQSDFD
ncbi:CLUMA_CG014815, isoform A [Clunio marinus]|uniref:CLUMA_CG014815, isoform A n=1 Tax=Clunio marinus TaxID=568069 RepID=A0A1J1IMD9_9DIPT|nr:CLUMA_CG014815, isoform A [Clunio marinus]